MSDNIDKGSGDWDNYWAGRKGDVSGSVLEGVGVEKDPCIKAFWTDVFSDTSSGRDVNGAILDLCCGAGTVIRAAQACGFKNLTGADISSAAIKTLKTEFKDISAVVTPADDTPFSHGQFSHVVSQFGFEYAGAVQTAPEIARILKSGGKFTALTHIKDGAIEAECAVKLADVIEIQNSGFIETAKALFRAGFGSNQQLFNDATQAFSAPLKTVHKIAKAHGGLAAHLYGGTQQLYARIKHHDLNDVLSWLDGMQSEISAFQGRMQSMVDAAMSEDDVKAFYLAMNAQGCETLAADVLKIDEARPVAWVLRAVKP